FSAAELRTWSFISFGASAAIAPADMKDWPVASEPRTFEPFTRMSSSLFRCIFLADELILTTNYGGRAGPPALPRQKIAYASGTGPPFPSPAPRGPTVTQATALPPASHDYRASLHGE